MPTSEPPYPEVPERRRFTIGQAATLARSKPHILRYWEKEIAPLAKVERRNGRRYYSREQVLMLQQIGRMLEGGATLAGVARRFARPRQALRRQRRLAAPRVGRRAGDSIIPQKKNLSPRPKCNSTRRVMRLLIFLRLEKKKAVQRKQIAAKNIGAKS